MAKDITFTEEELLELDNIGQNQPDQELDKIAVENSELTQDDEDDFLQIYDDNKEFGDRPLAAAAAGAARGVSFGVSDKVLTSLDLVDARTLRGLDEFNETASNVGEAGAVVASTLLSGGGFGAVKAAALAGKAVQRISAKALQKMIVNTGKEKFAASVIAKSIPRVAGSAVEGSFFGLGELISEEALGRAEVSAENIVAAVGTGALFGGATAGVFGTTRAASKALIKADLPGKAIKAGKTAAESVKTAASKLKSTAETAAGGAENLQIIGDIASITPGIGKTVRTVKFAKAAIQKTLTTISGVEKHIQTTAKRISKTLDNFENSTPKSIIPGSTTILLDAGIARPLDKPNKKPANKIEAIDNIRANLEAIEANPDILIERTATATADLSEAAPEIALSADAVFQIALSFIADKVPKPTADPGALQMIKRKFVPSSIEVAKFERYVHAVEKPIEAIEQLEAGQLSREAVEAIQVVYPEIYLQVQDTIIGNIGKNPEKYDYNKRLQLGVLLDIPVDSSLVPANILGLQQQFGDAEQSREDEISSTRAAVNTTQGGINKIESAERGLTSLQKSATRK